MTKPQVRVECSQALYNIISKSTNINHKGLQRTANEYAEERKIYKVLISKNKK